MVESERVCEICVVNPTPPSCEVQYVVARAHQSRAIVVAFRGTKTKADIAIDAKTKPNDLLQEIQSVKPLLVHGGVANQLLLCYDDLKAELLQTVSRPENKGMKIRVTGHSLGGAYAQAFALRALADEELRDVMLKHDFQVITFGSPRIIYKHPGMECGLEQLVPSAQTLSQFTEHHFVTIVNDSDIVPRLLGNKITGAGLAYSALKSLAKPVLSVHVSTSEVEKNLEYFEHLGKVTSLTDDGKFVLIQPEDWADFFKIPATRGRDLLANHSTGLYELRLYNALHEALGGGTVDLQTLTVKIEEDEAKEALKEEEAESMEVAEAMVVARGATTLADPSDVQILKS